MLNVDIDGDPVEALARKIALAIVPIGGIVLYAGKELPYGWLFCDGSAVSRAGYTKLFERIGTTFGKGDGYTTFNLPDLDNLSKLNVNYIIHCVGP